MDENDIIDLYVYETLWSPNWFSELYLQDKLDKHFNPQHGYCQTLNPNEIKSIDIDGAKGSLLFYIVSSPLIMFLHETDNLPDFGTEVKHLQAWYEIGLTKRFISQSNLERSPCAMNHYLTCQDKILHSHLKERHSCQAPILQSGTHLEQIVNVSHPNCSAKVLLEVVSYEYLPNCL